MLFKNRDKISWHKIWSLSNNQKIFNMKIIFTLAFSAMMGIALSQQTYLDKSKQKHLIGQFNVQAFKADTAYSTWYNKNYAAYQTDEKAIAQLKPLLNNKTKLQIFMGTWCGDSKREVPKFIKVLEQIGFTNYELIGTYDTDSLYKVSPTHEEKGLNIFRVPTFLVYKDGKEMNRIIEFPKESLEKDLIQILQSKSYTPNYNIGHTIDQYFVNKNYNDSIIDKNAKQLKGRTFSQSELNAKGYVELRKGNIDYAIAIFRLNARLYNNLDAYDSLAEAYTKNKEDKKAMALWQYMAEESNAINKKALAEMKKLTFKQ
jgi:thiol-disulfide isomerase/thioredoxin